MTPATLTSARALIEETLDEGTFLEWHAPQIALAVEATYASDLAVARQRSGEVESVVVGEGLLEGMPVAVVVGEFEFLGGSIGVRAAETIVMAFERATARGLPVLAAPVSGGTRMQEGTRAFLQMVKITEAVLAHKAARLPYLVYLRHPTTGGVFASWGSLGHVTVAQTGALIGFLGPKVYRALRGADFPAGVQTAENLFAHGIVDAVLDARKLRLVAAAALDVMTARGGATAGEPPAVAVVVTPADEPDDAWSSILISRRSARPGVRSLLQHAATHVVALSGTGQGEANKSSVIALAKFGPHGCVVVGLDRRGHRAGDELGPDALRQARRGMSLAADLGLPLVTVVDTPGAALSREAEEGGLGGEIARCLADLLSLDVPTVSVILGEGTGGGALALMPADRVIAARHGWLAPLPPEGASVIRYGDVDHAREISVEQRIRSADLLTDGIVDEIVDERPEADLEPAEFSKRVGDAVIRQLDALTTMPTPHRRRQRLAHHRRIGLL